MSKMDKMKLTNLPYFFRRLESGERPINVYEYYVIGSGYFPTDMLRRDAAWPADSDAASAMDDNPLGTVRKMRAVRLRSYKEPTIDRWLSFGWDVKREIRFDVPKPDRIIEEEAS